MGPGLNIYVFASNMGALPGDTDQDRIFMATRASATLPFGTASGINVGENTWPFITADGKTLYFSTCRPGGLGQAELMLSNYDHGSFTPPEFLPPSANVYPGGCALASVSVKGMAGAAPYLVPFALPLLLLILLRARIRRFSYARERVVRR